MEKMIASKLYVDSRSHKEEIRRKYPEMGYLVFFILKSVLKLGDVRSDICDFELQPGRI